MCWRDRFPNRKKLAENGAKVVVADLDPSGAQCAEELCALGAEAIFIPIDLGDE